MRRTQGSFGACVYNTKAAFAIHCYFSTQAWFIRRACHLAFEVTDFDQAEKTLREHGLEYSRHVLPEVNMKQLFLYDPEGHGIEIGVYEDTKDFFKEQGVEPPT